MAMAMRVSGNKESNGEGGRVSGKERQQQQRGQWQQQRGWWARKRARAARVMATATRFAGNEEGDVDKEGNGDSD
jgi:hypothetical protein